MPRTSKETQPQWGGKREGAGAPRGNTNRKKGAEKVGIAGWVTEEGATKLEEAAQQLGKTKSFLVGAFVEKALMDGTFLETMTKVLSTK